MLMAFLPAVERGDYTTAFKEWRPLVEQGHAKAENNLYYGVPKDYAEALKWCRGCSAG